MLLDGFVARTPVPRRTLWVIAGALTIAACSSRVHEMSLDDHEAAAAREEEKASVHASARDEAAHSAPSVTCTDGGIEAPCWTIGSPLEKHERAVRRHERLAEQHRKSASALRDAEARSCVGIAPSDRDISPFFHIADIAEVEVSQRTVVVTFRKVPGLTEDSLRATVECHLARNASLGHEVPHMDYCLLVPSGVTASVAAAGEELQVLVTARSDEAAHELHRRAEVLRAQLSAPGKPADARE